MHDPRLAAATGTRRERSLAAARGGAAGARRAMKALSLLSAVGLWLTVAGTALAGPTTTTTESTTSTTETTTTSTTTTTDTTAPPTTTTSTTETTAPPTTTTSTTETTAPPTTTTSTTETTAPPTTTTSTTETTAPPTTTTTSTTATTSSTTTTTVPVGSHDLAISQVKVSKKITLSDTKPAVTKKLKVTIVNQGSDTETIDAIEFEDLASIDWTSLPGPNPLCGDPATELEPPKQGFPVVLATKKKLSLKYEVTWNCANDDAKTTQTADHSDFEVEVTIDSSVLGGGADSDPSDDVCPRAASGDDKGCGRKTEGVIGGPITTDVVVK